jgi:hypothetical protein
MRSLNISSCLSSGLHQNDDAGLPAGDRGFGLVLGQAESALDAAGLGARHIAGDAGDLGVVVGIDHDLVVGAYELEHGVDRADFFAAGAAAGGQEQGQAERAERAQGACCMGWSWDVPPGVYGVGFLGPGF